MFYCKYRQSLMFFKKKNILNLQFFSFQNVNHPVCHIYNNMILV